MLLLLFDKKGIHVLMIWAQNGPLKRTSSFYLSSVFFEQDIHVKFLHNFHFDSSANNLEI